MNTGIHVWGLGLLPCPQTANGAQICLRNAKAATHTSEGGAVMRYNTSRRMYISGNLCKAAAIFFKDAIYRTWKSWWDTGVDIGYGICHFNIRTVGENLRTVGENFITRREDVFFSYVCAISSAFMAICSIFDPGKFADECISDSILEAQANKNRKIELLKFLMRELRKDFRVKFRDVRGICIRNTRDLWGNFIMVRPGQAVGDCREWKLWFNYVYGDIQNGTNPVAAFLVFFRHFYPNIRDTLAPDLTLHVQAQCEYSTTLTCWTAQYEQVEVTVKDVGEVNNDPEFERLLFECRRLHFVLDHCLKWDLEQSMNSVEMVQSVSHILGPCINYILDPDRPPTLLSPDELSTLTEKLLDVLKLNARYSNATCIFPPLSERGRELGIDIFNFMLNLE